MLRLEVLETRDNPSDLPVADPLLGQPATSVNPIEGAATTILFGVLYPGGTQPSTSATPPIVPTVKPNGP